MLKKIVAIGPEGTGKSTLCQQLARHYHTGWCPEYAREYLLALNRSYNYDDLLAIAQGQLALEDETVKMSIARQQPCVFIDTDMYVMKVWCEFVFGKCHRFILDQVVERKYHLYFLCHPDLPWVKDELREYPDLKTRQTLFRIYQDILTSQDVPWVNIRGSETERLQTAIRSVDKLLHDSSF